MTGMFVTWMLGIACLGIGYPVVRYLDSENNLTFVECTVLSWLIGNLTCFLLIWGVGVIDLSTTTMVPLGGAFILASVPGNIAWVGHFRNFKDNMSFRADPVFFLCLAIVTVLVAGLVINAFAPPGESDAVRYHLNLAKRDIEYGRIQILMGWGIHEFFPAALEMLYRFGMVLSDDMRSAQHIHVLFALASGVLTWTLARRLGASETVAMIAVTLFLSIRGVMYQSSVADIDLGLTAASAAIVLLLVIWREQPGYRLAILTGLVAGLALNIKYNAIVIVGLAGLIFLWISFRDRRLITQVVVLTTVALVVFAPLLARNFDITGNPIFPLYNDLFDSSRIYAYEGTRDLLQKGRGFAYFLIAPVTVFMFPSHFDGIRLSGPFLPVFLPFAWTALRQNRGTGPVLFFLVAFFTVWYWVMTLQVRFLLPVFPILAVMAALGSARLWQIVKPYRTTRALFILLCVILTGNQMMFYASTAIHKWPVALGINPSPAYFNFPSFLITRRVEACEYIAKNLEPGEKYLSLLIAPSVYCPQKSMHLQLVEGDLEHFYKRTPLRHVSTEEFIDIVEKNKIRFVVDDLEPTEDSQNPKSIWVVFYGRRFSGIIRPAIENIEPEFTTVTARIYNTRDIIAWLKQNRLSGQQ